MRAGLMSGRAKSLRAQGALLQERQTFAHRVRPTMDRRGFRARGALQPRGVPVGVIVDLADEACAYWVGDDVSRCGENVFIVAKGVIVEATSPPEWRWHPWLQRLADE